MTIPTDATPEPLPQLIESLQIIDVRTGRLTEHGIQVLETWRRYINGGSRIIPCSASTSSNVITLTPNDASPILERYNDYDVFVFVADTATTGSVTMTVTPEVGALETLNAYINSGAAQAGSGDVVKDSLYMAVFADHLNSNNGGFVLK